jgi:hypothetical protein
MCNRANYLSVYLTIFFALSWAISDPAWAVPQQQKFSINTNSSAEATAMTPNGRFIATISPSSNTLSIIDTSIFALHTTLTLSSSPTGIVASDDSTAFYISTGAQDTVLKVLLADSSGNLPSAGISAENLSNISVGDSFKDLAFANNQLFLLNSVGDKIHVYDLSAGAPSSNSGNPITLNFAALELRGLSSDDLLLVTSSAGNVVLFNSVTLTQLGIQQDLSSLTTSSNFSGLAIGKTASGTLGFSVNAISSGEAFGFNLGDTSNPLQLLDATNSTIAIDPISVGNQPVAAHLTSDHLYVANNLSSSVSVIKVADYFNSSITTVVPLNTISLSDAPIRRGFSGDLAIDGYLYLSLGMANKIAVLSENPTLTLTTPPDSIINSSSFSFAFTSDASGNYEVRRNDANTASAISASSGTLLYSGSANANQAISINLGSGSFVEGKNLLNVFLVGSAGTGRIGTKIDVQPPPKAPDNFHLEFGDQKIFIHFTSLEGSIDFYRIYFGNSATTLAGTTNLTSPTTVDHPGSGGKTVSYTLGPLANNQLFYVQVAAVNNNGIEGSKTEILSETPEETVGFLEVSGETGGCSFMQGASFTTPSLVALMALLLMTGFAVLSLRFRFRLFFLALMISALLEAGFQGSLQAQDEEDNHDNQSSYNDETSEDFYHPPFGVAIGANWWFPDESNLDRFYGDEGNELFTLRFNFSLAIISGTIEPGIESGILSEDRPLLGKTSNRESGEESSMLIVPIRFTLGYLIDPHQNWWIAPLLLTSYSWNYFQLDESGQNVDGFRQSLTGRVGFRLYLDRIMQDPVGWRDVLGLRSAYLDFSAGYEYSLSDGPFKTDGVILGPQLGIIL